MAGMTKKQQRLLDNWGGAYADVADRSGATVSYIYYCLRIPRFVEAVRARYGDDAVDLRLQPRESKEEKRAHRAKKGFKVLHIESDDAPPPRAAPADPMYYPPETIQSTALSRSADSTIPKERALAKPIRPGALADMNARAKRSAGELTPELIHELSDEDLQAYVLTPTQSRAWLCAMAENPSIKDRDRIAALQLLLRSQGELLDKQQIQVEGKLAHALMAVRI